MRPTIPIKLELLPSGDFVATAELPDWDGGMRGGECSTVERALASLGNQLDNYGLGLAAIQKRKRLL